ncbi:hypothetical protein GO495_00720 [Chitinophaga oryziterrae]|uniref:Uncharacterized protein n=1 Tax=Chitinophaga oryziterrae TaxID=1031224 RepID=A0A6N8J1N3_9BACT|nr:hypothetical protein [Chitinophaga oryziterrae]
MTIPDIKINALQRFTERCITLGSQQKANLMSNYQPFKNDYAAKKYQ